MLKPGVEFGLGERATIRLVTSGRIPHYQAGQVDHEMGMKKGIRGHVSIKESLLRWGPFAACMAAIFAGSSLTAPEIDVVLASATDLGVELLLRQALVHMVEYAVLAVLAYRLLSVHVRPRGLLWASVLAFSIAFGASDELHQALVPGRASTWQDLGYDSLGATMGLLVTELWGRLRSWSRPNS